LRTLIYDGSKFEDSRPRKESEIDIMKFIIRLKELKLEKEFYVRVCYDNDDLSKFDQEHVSKLRKLK
jgi:hypothetical protein